MKKIEIKLSSSEITFLETFIRKGKRNAQEYERALILLALHKSYSNSTIIDFLQTSNATIWRVKMRYLEKGLETSLKDAKRSGQPKKYTDKHEADIIAIACSDSPEGRQRWTLELLKSELCKIEGLENINKETIRLILKKTNISLG